MVNKEQIVKFIIRVQLLDKHVVIGRKIHKYGPNVTMQQHRVKIVEIGNKDSNQPLSIMMVTPKLDNKLVQRVHSIINLEVGKVHLYGEKLVSCLQVAHAR